jgi:hypothetical protein
METIPGENVKFLQDNFPDLAQKIISPEQLGPYHYKTTPKPNIFYRQKPFHSIINPEREALNLVKDLPVKKGILFLFIGIGLGYHLEKFSELYASTIGDATLIVLEKSVQAFSLLVLNKDISFIRGMHLFIGESEERVKSYIDALDPLSFKGYRIIRLRGSYSLFQSYYDGIECYFKDALSGKISNLLTRFAFESLWMKNIIENIPTLTGRRSIASLKGALQNIPALIISAGPSLQGQLELIASVQNRIHIIAVDTVIGPLLKSGIVPDFVITLDAGFFNYLDFRDLFIQNNIPRNINLIADMVAYPHILRQWRGNLYFSETSFPERSNKTSFSHHHPLIGLFHDYFPHSDSLYCGGSVSTTAIEFSLYLGAYPVFVTGLDLSYTQYKTHINSSPHYNEFYRSSDRLHSLETSMINAIGDRKFKLLPGIGGKEVLSDFIFDNYLKWIISRKEYRNRVLNLTLRGVKIQGLPNLSLEELAGSTLMPKNKTPLKPTITAKLTDRASCSFLEELQSAISQAKRDLGYSFNADLFVQEYSFLQNNVLEAQALYNTDDAIRGHLLLFLQFLGQHVDRSLQRLELLRRDETPH